MHKIKEDYLAATDRRQIWKKCASKTSQSSQTSQASQTSQTSQTGFNLSYQ